MNKSIIIGGLLLSIALLGLWFAQHSRPDPAPPSPIAPVFLALDGPVSLGAAEVSGLTWWGDDLLLLPQYGDLEGCDGPCAFELSRDELRAAIADPKNVLHPRPRAITLSQPLDMEGFEGFEAICLSKGQAFVLAETETETLTLGHLLRGTADLDLDCSQLEKLEPPIQMKNLSYEAMVASADGVLAIPELNDLDHAQATLIDGQGGLQPVPFPRLRYRVTDATNTDEYGFFWVSNVHWPGDGLGSTTTGVERLLRLRWTGHEVTGPDQIVDLALPEEGIRNWEGVARFERGLLMVTDEHPGTLLAWVPLP